MVAYMIKPSPGESNVDPRSEIIIVFESGEEEDVFIKIDNEQAVSKGYTHKGFSTTFSKSFDNKIIWGIRKLKGLPKRDILVQAHTSNFCYTVDQRFYVKKSNTKKVFDLDKKNWCHTKNKIYQSDNTPTRWGVDIEDFDIPESVTKGSLKLELGYQKGEWRVVSCHKDKVMLAGPDFVIPFYFIARDAIISEDIINLILEDGSTAHLPFLYTPAPQENCWFFVKHDKKNISFGDGIHVWWDEKGFITKRDIKPITGKSDDMLWTHQDVGTNIRSLEIVNRDILLINKSVIIHTDMPKVSYL